MKLSKVFAAALSCGILLNTVVTAVPADVRAEETVTIKYWNFPNFTSDSEFKTSEEYDAASIKAFERMTNQEAAEFWASVGGRSSGLGRSTRLKAKWVSFTVTGTGAPSTG